MPSLASVEPAVEESLPNIRGGNAKARTRCIKPLTYAGSLDRYEHLDLTPAIGREYYGVQVIDLLNSDEQTIKDLALTSKSFSASEGSGFALPNIVAKRATCLISLPARCRVPEKSKCQPSRDERVVSQNYTSCRMRSSLSFSVDEVRTDVPSLSHRLSMFIHLLKKEVNSETRSASSAVRSRRREAVLLISSVMSVILRPPDGMRI